MPRWQHKIYLSDIWHDEDLSFEQKRDAIVARLRASSWYKERDTDGFDDLDTYIIDLKGSEDWMEFNEYWAAIYDEADARHSCWIDLVSPVPAEVQA